MNPGDSNPLCLECGLCCNGVIFADVQLKPGDDARRLRLMGLLLIDFRGSRPRQAQSLAPQVAVQNPKFPQPCAALNGCRCRIYPDRPEHCRDFKCLLLQQVQAGRLDRAAALRVIRETRRRSDQVRRLLGELGDAGEQTALSLRFQRMQQRMEPGAADHGTAEVFSRLTLAVHDLNMLLSKAFYPGEQSGCRKSLRVQGRDALLRVPGRLNLPFRRP